MTHHQLSISVKLISYYYSINTTAPVEQGHHQKQSIIRSPSRRSVCVETETANGGHAIRTGWRTYSYILVKQEITAHTKLPKPVNPWPWLSDTAVQNPQIYLEIFLPNPAPINRKWGGENVNKTWGLSKTYFCYYCCYYQSLKRVVRTGIGRRMQ